MSTPIFAAYRIPGLNVAFLFSLFLTIALTLARRPVRASAARSARRSPGARRCSRRSTSSPCSSWPTASCPTSGSPTPTTSSTGGPTSSSPARRSAAQGIVEYLPFDITYQVVRDIIVVVIYVVFLGLQRLPVVLVAEPGQEEAAAPSCRRPPTAARWCRKG